jgi:hypothetical protein
MWNVPSKERLAKIPPLYTNDKICASLGDQIIYLHFFVAGCDWYITEYDGDDLFFGFAILNDDTQSAEWGLIPFSELRGYKSYGLFEVDCEHEEWFPVRPAKEVEKIINCPYGL